MSAQPLPLVVVLTGPTGTGKTERSLQLASELPMEIVSVDSAQVYRGMDIGTAKPSATQRAAVPHHLIDIRDPAERYSAGDFVRDALAVMAGIHSRGRIPLLVGGSMLYLRALWRGMAALPEAAPEVRASLDARAATEGWASLHRQLASIDPVAAARIHPNDPQRIQRALEVYELTGRSISDWQLGTRGSDQDYRWLKIALVPTDRRLHRERLADRYAAMEKAGFPAEVRRLYARGDLYPAMPAVRAVGYRQLWDWCAGNVSLDVAGQLAIAATCHLAKRQLTWLRSDSALLRVDPDGPASSRQVTDIVRKSMELL